MSRNIMHAVAVASMLGLAMLTRSEADDILDLDERPPVPHPPCPPKARVRTTEHQHGREIARRLRQQARIEAKRAARGQS